MKLTKDQLIGLYPALPTPTDPSGTVDRKATARLVEFLCAAGVNGLVPVGGTGEYAALLPAERRTMVEVTVDAAAGRVPVVAGILAPGFKEAVQAANDFAAAGVHRVLLSRPYYVTPTPEALPLDFPPFPPPGPLPRLPSPLPFPPPH